MERKFREDILVSDEKAKLQPDRIWELLKKTYWAGERDMDTVLRSIENSLCFGVYEGNEQIGFARCVTDYATMFWLADVVMDERFRGQGIGKMLIETILGHERLQGLTGLLATRDAQGFYSRYGFEPLDVRYYRKRPAQKTEESGQD